MPGLRVKVCGVTQPEHALAALDAGAAFIGLMFYPKSHRHISVEQARTIADAVRTAAAALPNERRLRLAGVFVNETPEHIRSIAEAVGLDYAQLHGDEPWSMVADLGMPVIKAVRVPDDADPEAVLADVTAGLPYLERTGSLLLLDAAVTGAYGGTGHRVNVELAQTLAARVPLLLAGGLTPENVAKAVTTVRPWGVDVSSGVETDRVKDVVKIRAFIHAALSG